MKTQAAIQYSDGTKFMADDLYYEGSGLISKVIKEGSVPVLEIIERR